MSFYNYVNTRLTLRDHINVSITSNDNLQVNVHSEVDKNVVRMRKTIPRRLAENMRLWVLRKTHDDLKYLGEYLLQDVD